MSNIIWQLSFSVWLTSLNIIMSRSIHVAANSIISFLLLAELYSIAYMHHMTSHFGMAPAPPLPTLYGALGHSTHGQAYSLLPNASECSPPCRPFLLFLLESSFLGKLFSASWLHPWPPHPAFQRPAVPWGHLPSALSPTHHRVQWQCCNIPNFSHTPPPLLKDVISQLSRHGPHKFCCFPGLWPWFSSYHILSSYPPPWFHFPYEPVTPSSVPPAQMSPPRSRLIFPNTAGLGYLDIVQSPQLHHVQHRLILCLSALWSMLIIYSWIQQTNHQDPATQSWPRLLLTPMSCQWPSSVDSASEITFIIASSIAALFPF